VQSQSVPLETKMPSGVFVILGCEKVKERSLFGKVVFTSDRKVLHCTYSWVSL